MGRIDISREQPWRVESSLADRLPGVAADDLAVEFKIPKCFKRVPLSVIVEAGKLELDSTDSWLGAFN